ncbi:MAG: Maf-like protein [Bacteroidales bacterium]
MLNNLDKYKILLASNSPRRRELLAGLDISYEVTALPDIDESFPAELPGEEIPVYIAKNKAAAYGDQMQEDTLLITADTIVWSEGKVYGKPSDATDAKKMLRALSGKTHQVITGVCIRSANKEKSFAAVSEVTFCELSDAEIDYYVTRYTPYDKAGSYGIQEWIGYVGVEEMKGSYFNVMGLPIQRLYKELQQF